MPYTRSQEFVAESFGVMVVVLFECGCVVMVVLFPEAGPVAHGGYPNIVLGWGLAVTFGTYVSGQISGAHLNPAVTLALAATGRSPRRKLPHDVASFRNDGLTDGSGIWRPPVLGPTIGGPLGAPAHDPTVGRALMAGDALHNRAAGLEPYYRKEGVERGAVNSPVNA